MFQIDPGSPLVAADAMRAAEAAAIAAGVPALTLMERAAEGAARAYPRLMLHAETLGLHHPTGGGWVDFAAECPF